MCMKCGCSIPNDKKSTVMILPADGKAKTVIVDHGSPKGSYEKDD